jgi:hypothetical protein
MASSLEHPQQPASLPSVMHTKSDRKKDKKKSRRSRETGKSKRLYRLPKPVLKLVCDFLTYEEMFLCASVCKKMEKKFQRMLTSYKHCSMVEKADIKLLLDPAAIADGMNFYRVPSEISAGDSPQFCRLDMNTLRSVPKIGIHQQEGRVYNAIQRSDTAHTAFHLKQLEHMIIYNTVNGNEIVRVANNWIFFNRKLFIKVTQEIYEATPDGASLPEEQQKFLVDIILVEANVTRRSKSFFGWTGSAFVEPFCEIALDGLHLRTSVVSHEVDPVWNEDCSFAYGDATTAMLQLTMYDHGMLGRHTKLGTVEISLKNLACDVLHDVWQPVQALDETFSGKFHILIQKTIIPKKQEVDTRNIGILGHCGPICDSVPIRLEFGDILVISNSEFYTHIAKLGTMSLWDHVAMVVERDGELHLFESTPDGVFTSPLSRRLKFYLKGSTLGVRRLTLHRTPEMKKALSDFIEEVDGRPYKQNWMDLMKAWKGTHTSEDLSSIFCSELMAAAYKRMGLLDNSIPSNNYLPADFALPNNPKVKLAKGKLEKIRMVYNL